MRAALAHPALVAHHDLVHLWQAALLITHELDGLQEVDEIVVLDEGRVSQRGTHRQLLAAGGLYRRMWLATHRGAGAAAGRGTMAGRAAGNGDRSRG